MTPLPLKEHYNTYYFDNRDHNFQTMSHGNTANSNSHWTPADEATLVQRREGNGWYYHEIAAVLQPRSAMACRQRYRRLSVRDLDPRELAELGQLWIALVPHPSLDTP